jgi:serine/threonine protein kinase/Tol biopolymer transport system component
MTAVAAGKRFGPYEVVSRIGGGGMGEVFRARDTRLDRTVAIKILPAQYADNAELRARFEREARAISQINHPNICALHDVGRAEGVEYLVLEFLEGETLTDRIAKGPLPIADVLRFGSQIASALACAHRAGIVHRDLKPGNVMITKSGAKLLDFGIARSAPAPAPPSDDEETQHKPLTQAGTILGTFQYMSPEQLAGEEVDPRSDIFALGAVLYEMLTGARAFEGKSRTSIVAAVLAGSPQSASSLRPTTPPALEHVIAKCLASEREERWESAADIASELEWIGRSPTTGTSAVAVVKPPRRAAVLTAMAVAAIVIAGAALTGVSLMRRVRLAEQPVRSELVIDEPLTPCLFGSIALSPDGTRLLVLIGPSGKPSIAIRNLATGETKKLAGTEGAIFPFWAPDSQRVGFFAGGKLKTIGVGGGSVQTICDAKQGRGGSWNRNGVILFTADINSPVYKVRENGGAPVPVTRLGPRETHRHPMFLPDGKRFLFAARIGNTNVLSAGSIEGNLQKRVVENASNAAFAHGRLFFVRDGNLVSQPFDPAKLEVTGTLTPIADRVEYFKVRAVGNFSVTETKMVYVSEASGSNEIVVHDRRGGITEIPVGAADYRILDISPDDRTLAVTISERFEQGDVWFVQLPEGTKSRLSFTSGGARGALSGAFSADGTRFAMTSGFFGQTIAFDVRSLIDNRTQKIAEISGAGVVTGWSPDGRYLVITIQDPKTGFDVQKLDVATGTLTPVVHGPSDELGPALSPNGKWLAYVSTESWPPEVYLTTFPAGEGKWQASSDGGNAPRWSRDGKQLYYLKDDRLMALSFHEDPMPQFGSATALPVNVVTDRVFINARPAYAVTSDGRFITTQPVGDTQPTIRLGTNWNDIVGR